MLRALDYFRSSGAAPDDRCAEAIDLVASKQDADGRWSLENTHQGPTHVEMEGPDGFPSRWNTLRAQRVLRWAEGSSNGGERPRERVPAHLQASVEQHRDLYRRLAE